MRPMAKLEATFHITRVAVGGIARNWDLGASASIRAVLPYPAPNTHP